MIPLIGIEVRTPIDDVGIIEEVDGDWVAVRIATNYLSWAPINKLKVA